MTKAELCVSDDRFNEVRLHELSHSAGHPSRLNRQINNVFGSSAYVLEELCAECAAAFLCAECGISQATIDDSASYIDSWIRQLKGNPKLFVQADILRDILRRGDEVLATTSETDFNHGFLHTIVNYAKAKQESEGALARIREVISIETHKPLNQVDKGQIRARFVSLLQKHFGINPQRANDLFAVLEEDAE
jgi:hypothetical protein